MGLIQFNFEAAQTSLDPDERLGLKIKSIASLEELNFFEQKNIEKAIEWSMKKNLSSKEILSVHFLDSLHKKMYGDVWAWAGKHRLTNKNIGVDKFQIPVKIQSLLEDCKYWILHKIFAEDEIAIRLKHKIVSIHIYANGNGRHSRLLADIFLEKVFQKKIFSWGRNTNLENNKRYILAIQKADLGNYEDLLSFARS